MDHISILIRDTPEEQLKVAEQQLSISTAEFQTAINKRNEELKDYSQRPDAKQGYINKELQFMRTAKAFADSAKAYYSAKETHFIQQLDLYKMDRTVFQELKEEIEILRLLAEYNGWKKEDLNRLKKEDFKDTEGIRENSISRAKETWKELF
jgi:hypothetical protein